MRKSSVKRLGGNTSCKYRPSRNWVGIQLASFVCPKVGWEYVLRKSSVPKLGGKMLGGHASCELRLSQSWVGVRLAGGVCPKIGWEHVLRKSPVLPFPPSSLHSLRLPGLKIIRRRKKQFTYNGEIVKISEFRKNTKFKHFQCYACIYIKAVYTRSYQPTVGVTRWCIFDLWPDILCRHVWLRLWSGIFIDMLC